MAIVSILTRPWGRVQPLLGGVADYKLLRFQSSPARGGGCNANTHALLPPPDQGFNPHPPVEAGATKM